MQALVEGSGQWFSRILVAASVMMCLITAPHNNCKFVNMMVLAGPCQNTTLLYYSNDDTAVTVFPAINRMHIYLHRKKTCA